MYRPHKSVYRIKKGDKSRTRLSIIRFIFIISIFIIILRLLQIQVFEHTKLSDIRKQQLETTIKVDPPRGRILDTNGKVLAENLFLYSIYAKPSKISDKNKVASKLSAILGISKGFILKRISNNRRFVWIKRKVTLEKAMKISREKIKYVGFVHENKRFYPYGRLASHVLGIVDIDNQGLSGIELEYNKYLRGQPGWFITDQDAFGRSLLNRIKMQKEPKMGYDIHLTIDMNIQRIVEGALKFGVKSVDARGGIVIIANPKTGAILALANYPDFNPNYPRKYSPYVRRDKAVTDVFEPGSTFKIVTISAALDKRVVKPTDKFYCENGKWKVYNHYIHDDKKYQWLSVREIIEKSSNIGTIKIAHKMKRKVFFNYIKSFGFGMKTGIDLPGEVSGILHPLKDWSSMSFYAVPIGHEVAVTAIQLLMALNVVADDGYLMKPYIVREVDGEKGVIFRNNPQIVRKVIKSSTAREVSSILNGVVEQGTGKKAGISGYEFSGKTGTSQIYDVNLDRYSTRKYMSSFVGFFPSDNPKITMVVIITEPSKLYYGGSVAAPIFRRIAEQIIRAKNILPNVAAGNTLVSMIKPQKGGVISRYANRRSNGILIPNFKGSALTDVLNAMQNEGLKYIIKDGRDRRISEKSIADSIYVVFGQVPLPGTKVEKADTIFIHVRKVKRINKKTVIPDFRGLTMREARKEAVINNLNVHLFGKGICTRQEPIARKMVPAGSDLNLYFRERD